VKETGRDYYQSLYEVAVALNSTRTPEDALQSIVERVAKAMGTKGCSLMLLTPDKKLLLHTAGYGLSDQYIKKGPVFTDKIITEVLEGRSVVVEDATTDDRMRYQEQAKKEGIASILSVPVMLRGEAVGILRVYTAQPRHFTKSAIYFMSAVANLGATCLENARLYDSIKKDYEALRLEIAEWRAWRPLLKSDQWDITGLRRKR